jgi:hypothetical protein
VKNVFEQSTITIAQGEGQSLIQPLTNQFGYFVGNFLSQPVPSTTFMEEIRTAYSEQDFASILAFLENLNKTCNNGKLNKKVPDFMFTAPEECKAGFLRAYFDAVGLYLHRSQICAIVSRKDWFENPRE